MGDSFDNSPCSFDCILNTRVGKQIADVKIPVKIHFYYVVALIPPQQDDRRQRKKKTNKQNKTLIYSILIKE